MGFSLEEALLTELDVAILLLRQVAFFNGSKQQGLVSLEMLAGDFLKWQP